MPLPCALSSTGQVQPCLIAASLPGLGVVMVCLSFHRNLHLPRRRRVLLYFSWCFLFFAVVGSRLRRQVGIVSAGR
jgi:hypothetical protein